jgi:microcystin-dependent protein
MIKSLQMSPSKRLYLVLIGVIGLLLAGLVGGAYGANTLLSSRAVKLTSLKAKSLALAQEQLSLINAKKDIKTYASLEQIARAVVPEDKDQAEAVREIVNIGGANNVSLASINFPASTLGTSSSGGTTATTTTPSASTSANANSSINKFSQLLPVKNIAGVYDLQITVKGDPNQPVQYNAFISFLSALEHNRRTAQISTITLEPNSANPGLLTFSLTLNEYIKP